MQIEYEPRKTIFRPWGPNMENCEIFLGVTFKTCTLNPKDNLFDKFSYIMGSPLLCHVVIDSAIRAEFRILRTWLFPLNRRNKLY